MLSAEELERLMKEKEYRGFLVVVEGGAGRDVSLPLLGRAREYADMLGVRVTALYLGAEQPNDLIKYGADIVYYTDALKNFEEVAQAVVGLAEKNNYEAIWFAATHLGNAVAPKVAAKLGTEVILNCTSLDIDLSQRRIHHTRKIFDGQVFEVVVFEDMPQVATIVPGALPEPFPDEFRYGRVEKLEEVPRSELVEVEGVREEAPVRDVLLVGGIELSSKENFELLVELGRKINADVKATRMAVEAGIAGEEYLLEVAGREPSPRVYVAFGVYGTPVQAKFASKADRIVVITKNERNPMLGIGPYNYLAEPVKVIK